MASASTMREALKRIYQSTKWSTKVDRMSDAQLYAVYSKFVERGTIKN